MADYSELMDAGIDVKALINRLMGNESLVELFVNKFMQDKSFSELEKAFEDKDYNLAEMKSHSLKGMCGNLSVIPLYELFTCQVNLIRSGKMAEAEEMMQQISVQYQIIISKMKLWLSKQ